jgi:hypothetical protein
MKAIGSNFASLRPYRLARKPIIIQHIWECSVGIERGKTVHTSADSFKFALDARTCKKWEGTIGYTLIDLVSS